MLEQHKAVPRTRQLTDEGRVAALELLAGREAIEGDYLLVALKAMQIAFGVRWAAAGFILDDGVSVAIQHFLDNGVEQPVFTYEMVDSPCRQLYDHSKDDFYFCPEGLQGIFPSFDIFHQLGAVGYLAEVFHGNGGVRAGHCAIMDDEPLEVDEEGLAFFHLVIQRISAEYRRQQAEAEAATANARMEHISRASADWFWETDEAHRYVWVGASKDDRSGMTQADFIGKERREIADPGDLASQPEKWAHHEATLKAHEPFQEFRYHRLSPTGIRQEMRTNGVPFYHPDGSFAGYRGTASIIAENDRVEQALAENKARFDFIIAGSGAALWDWNLETGDRWFSNGWKHLLGLTTDITSRFELFQYIHPDDREQHRARLVAHFKGETELFLSTVRVSNSDNGWGWIECRGYSVRDKERNRAIRFSGQALDITRLKNTEAALRASETRYAMAFEAFSEGIWEWQVDREMVLISPRLAEIFGIDPSVTEIPAATLENMIDPGDLSGHHDGIRAYFSGKTPAYECTYKVHAADGKIRWVQSRGLAEFGTDGRAIRMVGSVSDITLLRQREAELNAALEEAQFANRAKIEFLANMSHELRTPLNSIIGFSETIRDRLFGDDLKKYSEYAFYVCESARHLLELINDILDVSRIEAGEMPIVESEVNAETVMHACSRLMERRMTERRITFSMHAPKTLPHVMADERRLKQIFVNLLGNAAKFTDPGGVIEFSAEFEPTKGLTFTVTDTGIGIPEAMIEDVMDMFRQVDGSFTRNYEGVGLGLPLCRKLTELHDGSFELHSREGVGTSAVVRLPLKRCITG
jgi:PAS domain S-box-containing protein